MKYSYLNEFLFINAFINNFFSSKNIPLKIGEIICWYGESFRLKILTLPKFFLELTL